MISDKTIQLALDLLIKYKTQVTFLIILILMIFSFFIGEASKDCPKCPEKSVVCKDIIKTRDRLFGEVEKEKNSCSEKIRKKIDEEETNCKNRIRTSVDSTRKNYSKITCKVCKAMKGQCSRR